jgi:hypothetical protein
MIDHPLTIIHSHCPTCGCPVLWNADEDRFSNLNGGDWHVCREEATVECDCGAILAQSRYGWTWDRETRKPHLCEREIDRIERDLAFDRRSWTR